MESSAPQRASYPNCEADTPEDHADRDADEHADRRGVERLVGQEAEDHAADDAADQEAAEPDEVTATQAALGRFIGHPVWSVRAVGAWSTGREPCTSARCRSERASAGDDARTLPQAFRELSGRFRTHLDTASPRPWRGEIGAVVMAAFSGRQRRSVSACEN
jgi:hypothetical protein